MFECHDGYNACVGLPTFVFSDVASCAADSNPVTEIEAEASDEYVDASGEILTTSGHVLCMSLCPVYIVSTTPGV